MKKILIATNFSCHSRHTIEYVLRFLQETQIPCHITLLNTYLVQQTDPDQVIQQNDELKARSRSALEGEKAQALKLVKNPLITIDVASHIGSLNNVVLQLLQKEKFDLVAMGKSNGRHVERISTLLKKQQCPLLVTYYSP